MPSRRAQPAAVHTKLHTDASSIAAQADSDSSEEGDEAEEADEGEEGNHNDQGDSDGDNDSREEEGSADEQQYARVEMTHLDNGTSPAGPRANASEEVQHTGTQFTGQPAGPGVMLAPRQSVEDLRDGRSPNGLTQSRQEIRDVSRYNAPRPKLRSHNSSSAWSSPWILPEADGVRDSFSRARHLGQYPATPLQRDAAIAHLDSEDSRWRLQGAWQPR